MRRVRVMDLRSEASDGEEGLKFAVLAIIALGGAEANGYQEAAMQLVERATRKVEVFKKSK